MEFLSHRIVRIKVKNNGHRKKAALAEEEPDFYKMPNVPRNPGTNSHRAEVQTPMTLSSLLFPPRHHWATVGKDQTNGALVQPLLGGEEGGNLEPVPMEGLPNFPSVEGFPDLSAILSFGPRHYRAVDVTQEQRDCVSESDFMRAVWDTVGQIDPFQLEF